MRFTIRTKLTFQFSFIVLFILVFFSIIIYYFSASYRESEFYSRLGKKALTTAKLLIEVKEVDYTLMKIIDRNSLNSLYNEKVTIYDQKGNLIYNSSDSDSVSISPKLLELIKEKKLYAITMAKMKQSDLFFLLIQNHI